MCGIAGIISSTGFDAEQLIRMTDAIRHRGPDDEGFFFLQPNLVDYEFVGGADTPASVFGGKYAYNPAGRDVVYRHPAIGLGHRRLAIVDISEAGHQPMSSAGGDCWIVYNGEIYNHVELREELNALGHQFVSGSDTEVILAAWQAWGRECLHRFNGMFTFLLLDLKRRVLFAARDRFGIKPLYFRRGEKGELAFASEIKQFTVLPDWRAELNRQRAYDFLVWSLLDHTDETLFDGVYQLRPGEALELELDDLLACGKEGRTGLPVYRWYELKPEAFHGSLDDAGKRFLELMTDSVKLRLRADVPVGSCLSGGLDSSSIVVLVNQLLAQQGGGIQKTFSACSEHKQFDERDWIEEVLKGIDADAHYVYPSLDTLFDDVNDLIWHQDEPFASTSIYAQWNVFRLAANKNVKVMLDGQGADEQLAGYTNFFGVRLSTLFRQFRWLKLIGEARESNRLHGYSQFQAAKSIASNIFPDAVAQFLRRASGHPHSRPVWLDYDKLPAKTVDPFQELGARRTTIQEVCHSLITATNLQMLLHWEDRNSMAHSIEARVPFMDFRLVETLLGMPDEYKLSNGITKKVLRSGMQGVLPEKIRMRMDKLGFATPEAIWMKDHEPDKFKQYVMRAIESSRGIIRPEIKDATFPIIEGRKAYSYLPWKIICFGLWMERFKIES